MKETNITTKYFGVLKGGDSEELRKELKESRKEFTKDWEERQAKLKKRLEKLRMQKKPLKTFSPNKIKPTKNFKKH